MKHGTYHALKKILIKITVAKVNGINMREEIEVIIGKEENYFSPK